LSSPHRGANACGKTTHTPTGLRRTLFSALTRRTVRAVRFTHRGPSTGGVTPGRFRGCWLRRSPPRPSIHGLSVCIGALEVPTTGVRDTFERVHATLLTLTPTFPSRPDSMRSDLPAGLPLLGCPKIAPSSSRIEESDARGPRLRGSLRGRTASPSRAPSPWFRTTSTVHSSPTVQVCCALLPILGFTVFRPVAKRASSRCGSCPSKLSLRRQRRLRSLPCGPPPYGKWGPSPRARVTGTPIAGRLPSPLALPPHPSLRAP